MAFTQKALSPTQGGPETDQNGRSADSGVGSLIKREKGASKIADEQGPPLFSLKRSRTSREENLPGYGRSTKTRAERVRGTYPAIEGSNNGETSKLVRWLGWRRKGGPFTLSGRRCSWRGCGVVGALISATNKGIREKKKKTDIRRHF